MSLIPGGVSRISAPIKWIQAATETKRLSDGKSKGSGNRKTGNRYLSWAFSEVALIARKHNQRFQRYYDRKAAQTNSIVAARALSNKLARVCYYIMRDQVAFNEDLILY